MVVIPPKPRLDSGRTKAKTVAVSVIRENSREEDLNALRSGQAGLAMGRLHEISLQKRLDKILDA
ncbi:MAG: hypothetical protein M0Z41_03945 [Peptococcaceae bacterium]|jgi:hypothetical protein|nr:hypothetical protein [Peptococcaceae bacterium]